MKTRKFISLLFVSLLFVSCKKQHKEDTVVNFHLYNPVTNEGYSGVKVAIYEMKDVTPTLAILQSEYENNKIWEGKTDAYGKASHSFKGYKSDKYTYWHYVDESFMIGKKIIKQPQYGPMAMLSETTLFTRLFRTTLMFLYGGKTIIALMKMTNVSLGKEVS